MPPAHENEGDREGSELPTDAVSEASVEGPKDPSPATNDAAMNDGGSAVVEVARTVDAPALPVGLWIGLACGVVMMATLLVFGRPKKEAEEILVVSAASGDVAHAESKLPTSEERTKVAPAGDDGTGDGEAMGGIGQLLARRPGKSEDKERAVRLSRHAVLARVAGNVARTEIDETFTNDTDDELEGIYRFPLPHGAQIERLALEVDGKLVEGSFVDRARASAIWRGALHAAAPKAPKPREEIVWVPGPWHDPALLEWTRGGRFELRVFPIPKRGSRRIVVAYTEIVAPSSGVRRYVYPLPRGAGAPTIDEVSFDAQVVGHDAASGVRAAGYRFDQRTEASTEKLSMHARSFVPAGDWTIDYALSDRDRDWTAWGYRAPSDERGSASGDDAFVAIALRPTWPKPVDTRARDVVLVVDAGRSMFGERFARARNLAVALVRRADPRDRVAVLACDVGCRALDGGFVTPGERSARDVEAFLAKTTPDGASDLVAAVREALAVPGRDRARDSRIVMIGDGVASAGYRSRERMAAAVRDGATDPSVEIVTVPVGADADAPAMEAIARAGGGAVVPYGSGRKTSDVAREVLDVTSGAMLRDVSLALPDDLYDVAPRDIGSVRPGQEVIVTARARRSEISGDVRLNGTVAGAPFEATYAVRATATTDRANAFVPRLHAVSRIADAERDGTEEAKGAAIALSKRYAVPSRWTSLLVLESEAMFTAFGIERTSPQPSWTGDEAPEAEMAEASRSPAAGGSAASMDLASGVRSESSPRARAFDEAAEPKKAARAASSLGRAAPSPTMAPPFVPPPPLDRPGRYMKKTYVRRATIAAAGATRGELDKLDAAREAVMRAPDERAKRKEFARLLSRGGRLDELDDVLAAWETRDPFDVDALLFRADAAGRRGDREASLRIATGALSSLALSDDDAFTLATTLARSYERVGDASVACALRITAAELKGNDADARARAVLCERRAGRTSAADRWLDGLDGVRRRAVEGALAHVDDAPAAPSSATIVVSAKWEDGADLDLSIVDPSGRRAAAATRLKGARAAGATSRDHETIGLSTGEAGPFLIEIARAGGEGPTRVRGELEVRAFGKTKTLPFVVTTGAERIARIDVRWDVELVPIDGIGRFDRLDPSPRPPTPPIRPMRRDPVIFGP